jgi:stress-induced morphogen
MLDAKTLENLILQTLQDATVRVENMRGDGESYYAAHVSSPSFAGKTRVQQHQMVYAALRGHLNIEIQALSLQTSTPAV